jgi:hypothetical protein
MATSVPPVTPPAEPQQGNSMTLDEMEAADAREKAATSATPTPEQKAAEERIQRLEASLRLSEDARTKAIAEAAARAAVPAPAPAPVAPAPEEPKDLTAEELEQLVREDPTKALTLAMEQTRRRTTRDLEARINPLVNANVTTAEAMARQKYASDFEILGPEIEAFMKTIPEAQRRVALADSQGWDTMLSYVRGQNMDKVVSARVDKAINERLGTARAGQAAVTPPNLSSSVATPAPVVGGVVFDATTIEIMKNVLNCEDTPAARAEWTKWANARAG